MNQYNYRVTVRGKFDRLTEGQCAKLRTEAAEHDIVKGGFSQEGTFTYHNDLLGFTFRYELAVTGENGERVAGEQAKERALARLGADQLGHRDLRCSVLDMREIKIRRR